MKQIAQDVRKGQVKVWDVPVPTCGAGEVLVRVGASLISAGTERMVMEFASKSMLGKAKARPDLVRKVLNKLSRDGLADTVGSVFAKLDEPLPLGYAAAGVVIEVGSKLLNEFAVGDRVAIAGAGLANHAEVCAVPKNLVVALPKNLALAEGCYATLGAIALQGVRQAGVVLGDRVLVVGAGLVGQLAAQLATAAGARVCVLDPNKARVALAEELGAELGVRAGDDATFGTFTGGRGFDAVLLCAASESNELINAVAGWARDRATVVLVGKVGTGFDFGAFMKKELVVKVSRSYGPGRYDASYEQGGVSYPLGYVAHTERDHLAEFCHLVAVKRVNVAALTTHTFDFGNALDAYAMLDKGGYLGVVLAYAEGGQSSELLEMVEGPLAAAAAVAGELRVGVIGTGGFARSVLLPKLCKIDGVRLGKVASKGGLSAAHTAKTLGGVAVSGAAEVLADTDASAVMILTRHNTHAGLVVEALKAGKHVWVEKPLAMTAEELDAVEKAYAKYGAPKGLVLMVGFNRRYAPAMVALKRELAALGAAPRQVVIRVNAGKLDGGWQTTEEGGGRLLGEVCHFTDLAMDLAGSPVTHVHAVAGAGQDVYVLTLRHANGGVSALTYTSEGDPAAAKERVEVFAGGAVGVMDNYRTTTWSRGGKVKVLAKQPWWAAQDKGHGGALGAWTRACKGEVGTLPPVRELMVSSRVILAAVESLRTGSGVNLE